MYVYAVYAFCCIFIGGTVKQIFYRSFVRILAGFRWWFWLAAAGGGGGSVFSEFERILYFQIRVYSFENRGYFKLSSGFRCWIFATSGSSIHTQPQTVLPTLHLHPTTYLNGLPNGKTSPIPLSHYPTPNSNYLKINPYNHQIF